MAKMGRPTKYSEKLADLICEKVATNPVGLPELCNMFDELPDPSTVRLWRYKYHDFSVKYAKAKLEQADLLAEQTLTLARQRPYVTDKDGNEFVDSGHVAANRLEIDTLKWHASKLLPKQYGKAAEEVVDNKDSIIDKLIDKIGN